MCGKCLGGRFSAGSGEIAEWGWDIWVTVLIRGCGISEVCRDGDLAGNFSQETGTYLGGVNG